MSKLFLTKGNGHQIANRRKALAFAAENIEGIEVLDERTVQFAPYGTCHFAAYTHPEGAMISTPGRDDNEFGSADWHHRDRIMLFRDYDDGRVAIFVCAIRPLFEKRTIGHHGVRWEHIIPLAEFTKVLRV